MCFDHAQMKGCRPRTNRACTMAAWRASGVNPFLAFAGAPEKGAKRTCMPEPRRFMCSACNQRASGSHLLMLQEHACKAARVVAAAWGSNSAKSICGAAFGGPPLLHVWSPRVPAQTWTLLGGHALQAATGLGDLVPRFLRGQQGLQIVQF